MVDTHISLVEKLDTHGGNMKITRTQLRRLISETIYVNPKGDAYDTTSDPSGVMKQFHDEDAKRDFLKAQGNPKLSAFAPERVSFNIDPHNKTSFDQKEIDFMDQGVALADMVGDQGEFKPFEFSEDELELKDYAHDEMKKAYDKFESWEESGDEYLDQTALQKGTPYFGGETDYSEHMDQIKHQMSLKAKKLLKMFPNPEYFDVIQVLQEVPSYERLMRIIADEEGDSSPSMKKLKKLPEFVANQHGVHY